MLRRAWLFLDGRANAIWSRSVSRLPPPFSLYKGPLLSGSSSQRRGRSLRTAVIDENGPRAPSLRTNG